MMVYVRSTERRQLYTKNMVKSLFDILYSYMSLNWGASKRGKYIPLAFQYVLGYTRCLHRYARSGHRYTDVEGRRLVYGVPCTHGELEPALHIFDPPNRRTAAHTPTDTGSGVRSLHSHYTILNGCLSLFTPNP